MRTSGKITLCVVLIAVIGLWQWAQRTIPQGLLGTVQRSLKSQGILMEYEHPKLDFPLSLSVDGLGFLFPARPLPLPLRSNRLSVSASFLSLLRGAVDVQGELSLYGGIVHFSLAHPWWGVSDQVVAAKAEKLSLAEYQVTQALGLSGLVNLNLDSSLSPEQNAKVELQAALADGSYSGGHKLQGGLFITPAIQNVSAHCNISLLSTTLRVRECSAESSLGAVDIAGRATVDERTQQISKGIFGGLIKLSPEGLEKLGGYLALSAGTDVETPSSNWNYEITFTEPGTPPIVRVRPA